MARPIDYTREEALEKLQEVVLKTGRRVHGKDYEYYDIPSRTVYVRIFDGITNAYEHLEIHPDELEVVKQEPTFEPDNIKEAFGIGV